jgi:hypothetical protein
MKWYDKNEYQDPRTWQQPTVNWVLVLACAVSGFIMGLLVMTLINWGAR